MNKKFLSTILAGACALSCMSLTAFAGGDDDEGGAEKPTFATGGAQTITVEAGTYIPTLDVVIPAEVKAFVNPYGLEIDFNDPEEDEADPKLKSDDLIASPTYAIENWSTCSVEITATVSGSASGSAKLLTAAKLTEGSTTKDLYVYLTTNTEGDAYDAAKGDILVTTKEVTQALIADAENAKNPTALDAAEAGEDGEVTAAGDTLEFKLAGEVNNKNLKEAWAAKDGVKIKLIFKAAPVFVEE